MPDTAIMPVLPHLVYYRSTIDKDGDPAAAGEWLAATNIRCNSVTASRGARVGMATFSYVPENSTQQAAEVGILDYRIFTQLRVVALPMDDDSVQQGESVSDGYVLHEGLLVRPGFDIQASSETVTYISQPLPAAIDDTIAEHLITGRWVMVKSVDGSGKATDELVVVECNSVPAVFNFGGRPNMGSPNVISARSPATIPAAVFTSDYDWAGIFWTVRHALLSLIVMWLFGASETSSSTENNLPRHTGIEAETLAALLTGTGSTGFIARPDRWQGIDNVLPETNVHGLGVLSAIEAVCKAGGFEMAVETVKTVSSDDPSASASSSDRSYELRIWRQGAGPEKWFHVASRGSTFDSPATAHERNDMNQIRILADSAEIANHITTSGREFIEAWHILKPMWAPSDLANITTLTPELTATTVTDTLLSNEFFKKHHPKGADYNSIALRQWGLVTQSFVVGTYYPAPAPDPAPGSGEADYEQASEGYDFVTALKLTNSTKYSEFHDTVKWMRRRRLALPLRSKVSQKQNVRFLLEVSEDAGNTWEPCYAPFSTLTNDFGIDLRVVNFAAVNNKSFPQGPSVDDVTTSWFALIRDKKLVFRLLCAVESDNALRHTAAMQTSSGSPYQRAMLDLTDISHVWLAADHPNATNNSDYSSDDTTLQQQVQIRAQVLRDRFELARVSGQASTFRMDLVPDYKLGYRISGVQGRKLNFAVDRAGKRAPSIVSITYQLTGKRQGISMNLQDTRMGGTA